MEIGACTCADINGSVSWNQRGERESPGLNAQRISDALPHYLNIVIAVFSRLDGSLHLPVSLSLLPSLSRFLVSHKQP